MTTAVGTRPAGGGVERVRPVRVLPPPSRKHRPLVERQPSAKAHYSRVEACHDQTGAAVCPEGWEWPYVEGRPYYAVDLAQWTVAQLEAFVGEKDIPPGSISRFTRKAAAMLTMDAKRYLMWSYNEAKGIQTSDMQNTDWRYDAPSPEELAALLGG